MKEVLQFKETVTLWPTKKLTKTAEHFDALQKIHWFNSLTVLKKNGVPGMLSMLSSVCLISAQFNVSSFHLSMKFETLSNLPPMRTCSPPSRTCFLNTELLDVLFLLCGASAFSLDILRFLGKLVLLLQLVSVYYMYACIWRGIYTFIPMPNLFVFQKVKRLPSTFFIVVKLRSFSLVILAFVQYDLTQVCHFRSHSVFLIPVSWRRA